MEQSVLELNLDSVINKVGKFDSAVSNLSQQLGNLSTVANTLGVNTGALGKAMSAYAAIQNLANTSVEGGSKAMKLFNAALGPIGIIVGVVAGGITLLSERIKANEQLTNRLNIVFAKFTPVMEIFGKVLDVVAGYALDLADGFMNAIPKALGVMGKALEKGLSMLGITGTKFNDMAEALKNVGAEINKSVKVEKDRQDNVAKNRQENLLLEKSLQRQAVLQEHIAKTSDPRERKKYYEQLKKEIKESGDIQAQQAQRLYDIEKRRQSLSPSTEKEVDYLNKLKVAAEHEQTLTTQRLAAVEKRETLIAKIEAKYAKASAKEREKAIADALKEQEKQERESARISNEIYKQSLEERKYIKQESSYAIEDTSKELKRQKELGLLTYESEKKLNEQIYNLKLEQLNKQIEVNNLALTNTKLNEEDKLKIYKENALLAKEIAKEVSDYKIQIEITTNNKIKDEISNASTESALEEYENKLLEYREQGLISQETYLARLGDVLDREVKIRKKNADNTAKEEARKQQMIEKYTKKSIALTASSISTIGKMMADDAKEQVKLGKMSEEEGKKKFEQGKKMQIAAAIVSTIAGAVDAQMSVWKEEGLPLYAKIAMSSALGLDTLLSGYQQIDNIKKQQWDSTETGNSSAHMGGSAKFMSIETPEINPLIDENRDLQAMQTIPVTQEQQPQRVYILESDIQESNKKVGIVETNITF